MSDREQLIIEKPKIIIEPAKSAEENFFRYLLITDKYERKGYLNGVKKHQINGNLIDMFLTEDFFMNGFKQLFVDNKETGIILFDQSDNLFIDKYHSSSIPFIAIRDNEIVGSARIIEKKPDGLPTLNIEEVKLFDEYAFLRNIDLVEFSQFAVKEGECANISVGLIKIAYQYSMKIMKIDKWVATIDNSVLRFFNSRLFNFNLQVIGPSINYLGSECTPVFIDLMRTLEHSASFVTSRSIARFILDIDNDGFEEIKIEI